jgi:hypothetical protein
MRGIREAVADSWIAPLFSGQAFTGLFAWLAERGMIDTFATGVPRVTGISVDILWFFGIACLPISSSPGPASATGSSPPAATPPPPATPACRSPG